MPALDLRDGVAVADQYRVDPFAKQSLGQLGIVPTGVDEVAEGPRMAPLNRVTGAQQRRGPGSQADPVPLEIFQRLAAGGKLGHQLL